MGLERVKTDLSVQYVDHNLIQEDYKNPDDHLFLHCAAQRFSLWFSRPGNRVSHPGHQERFGKPGGMWWLVVRIMGKARTAVKNESR
jgi:aconitate hydratase